MRQSLLGLFILGSYSSFAAETIVLESPSRIVVRDLSSQVLNSVHESSLRVFVVATGSDTAILGMGNVEDRLYVFEPSYPLRPGIEYRAVFEPLKLVRSLKLPDAPSKAATQVTAVYPTGNELPENQLKFYVHFSSPMNRGDSYRHIQLLDASGQPVELPFVEIAEELWDAEQRRLTLLLDPGRIKRGLKPNEDVGPPLVNGHNYTLVVNSDWLDAERKPLARKFKRLFRVGPFDAIQPNPSKWRLNRPQANTNESLTVQFGEPLDHALLEHSLTVIDSTKQELPGEITIVDYETTWVFTPYKQWKAGDYSVCVDTTLEDLAGNSIQRPFEVDESTPQKDIPKQIELPFEVR